MEKLLSKPVYVIGATKDQLENFDLRYHPTESHLAKAPFVTDEQIHSVPDKVFNINLSDEDKQHLLLDCFVPYTEKHLQECNHPEILLSVFLVVNNQIIYFNQTNGDMKDLRQEDCKYLE